MNFLRGLFFWLWVVAVWCGGIALVMFVYQEGSALFDEYVLEKGDFSVCKQAIASKAPYPTKVDFGERTDKVENELRTIQGTVDFMNVYGAMIPHNYRCHMKNGEVYKIEVRENRR